MKRVAVVAVTCLAILVVWLATGRVRTNPELDVPLDVSGPSTPARPTEISAPERALGAEAATVERREAAASTESLDPGPSLVRVHVLASEDARPLAGILLDLRGEGSPDARRPATTPRARWGENPLTGADGWAEAQVPSGVALRLQVINDELPSELLDVSPLAAGERREVEWRLRTQPDFVLHGILLDGETRQGVSDGILDLEPGRPGIRVSTRDDDEPEIVETVRTRPDGRFELRGRSWHMQFVRASSPQHALAVFPVSVEHPSPAAPLEIWLWRRASLDIRVENGAGAPLAGVPVDVSVPLRMLVQGGLYSDVLVGEQRWRASSEAGGGAVLDGLVPRVALSVGARLPGAEPREMVQGLVLAPGERRELVLRVGSGATIQGRILGEGDAPLGDRPVWRSAARSSGPGGVILHSYDQPETETRTDADGRFRFEDVPVGSWTVGLAPPGREGGGKRDYPAYGEIVVVATPGEVLEVTLRVRAGLFLRGKVVDPGGQPVARCYVAASNDEARMFPSANTDAAGDFSIGPVPAGSWQVMAGNPGLEFAPSPPVTAEAGGEPIVLTLRLGAACSGEVVRSDGVQSSACNVSMHCPDPVFRVMSDTRGSQFAFRGLLPGNYVLVARDRAGWVGVVRGLRLDAGDRRERCTVELRPGAKLQLSHPGPSELLAVQVVIDGDVLELVQVQRERGLELHVPPGSVELRWDHEGAARSKTVVVAAGDTLDVVLDEGR